MSDLIARLDKCEKATRESVLQAERKHEEFARICRVNDCWDKLHAFRSLDLQDFARKRGLFVSTLFLVGKSILNEGFIGNVPAPQKTDTDARAFALELLQLAVQRQRNTKQLCLAFLVR